MKCIKGDWGLGIGDWGLGIGQSPIPNPQSPIPIKKIFEIYLIKYIDTISLIYI